jgi:hypothetical protein
LGRKWQDIPTPGTPLTQTAAGKYTSKLKKGCINIDTMGGKNGRYLER